MSYIVTADEKSLSQERVNQLTSELNINKLDITRVLKKDTSNSIGIKDIKEMMQQIYLKPLKGKEKAIIIEDAELLTREAQNSLLKVLEEPPASTYIILAATTKEAFLPTILSRCKLIELFSKNEPMSEEQKQITEATFLTLSSLTPKNALEIGERLSKKKDDTPRLVRELILVGESLMRRAILDHNPQQFIYAQVLRKLQSTHKNLSTTNINPRLELEHCLLSL